VSDEQRRAELADFLKIRRLALQPEEVGLKVAQSSRRRTPGLRREEVADLAGISISWYTWLEQGRKIRVSTQVLGALSTALRLSTDQRDYLFTLAHADAQPNASNMSAEPVRPALHRIIHSQDPNPAYILGPRLDLLAWNRATTAVYGDLGAIPPQHRHVLWLLFGGYLRTLIVNWEPNARFVLAAFRANTGRYVHERWFTTLVGELSQCSEQFRDWWSQHDVERQPVTYKELSHPLVGRLVLEQTALLVDDCSGQRIILYTPQPGTGTEPKLTELAHQY
jgi:transcriptional regulator with XRE-family HTH domain